MKRDSNHTREPAEPSLDLKEAILQHTSGKDKAVSRFWGLRWWMMLLLMLGSILNYLTRSTLAVAAPTLLQDLRISEQEYSWIVSAFQIAIMFQPLVGYVLDVLGLRIGLLGRLGQGEARESEEGEEEQSQRESCGLHRRAS
jgi:uncharacterized membrane protein